MELINKGKGHYTFMADSGDSFNINEADQHTATMLSDFINDPVKAAQFNTLILEHGASDAYYLYNGLEIPQQITENL